MTASDLKVGKKNDGIRCPGNRLDATSWKRFHIPISTNLKCLGRVLECLDGLGGVVDASWAPGRRRDVVLGCFKVVLERHADFSN